MSCDYERRQTFKGTSINTDVSVWDMCSTITMLDVDALAFITLDRDLIIISS